MARRNGSIIGPANIPTGGIGGVASGVWRIQDAMNYQKAGLWPVVAANPTNSVRFNSGSSDYLSRTPASAGNRKTWTYSGWIKRTTLDVTTTIFASAVDSNNRIALAFGSGNNLAVTHVTSGTSTSYLQTNALYRDVSAWYHILFAFDTTQATATNRLRLYVNGSEVTSFLTDNRSSIILNSDGYVNNNILHSIGRNEASVQTYANYYLSDVYLIDGQALDASYFGEVNSATGIWTPVAYSGSFGTNGFNLKFENAADLGEDSSTNGNDFTVNNLTSIDQTTDLATNNYATFNPLRSTASLVSFAQGNLKATALTDASKLFHTAYSSIGVTQGKWYAEFKCAVGGSPANNIIVGGGSFEYTQNSANQNGNAVGITAYNGVGSFSVDTVSTTGLTTYTAGDIIGVHLNVDDNEISFYKNGVQVSTTRTLTTTASSGITYFIAIVRDLDDVFSSWEANFGNAPFTISSGNSDANGFGNFEYSVPSGYYALNTYNLNQLG